MSNPQQTSTTAATQLPVSYDKQRNSTTEYVQRAKIQELLSHLLQHVVYRMPEDPKAFMVEELLRLQAKQTPTSLFHDEELDTMFDLIDVTNQKHISVAQTLNACRNLSQDGKPVTEADLPAEVVKTGRVPKDVFKAVVGKQLATVNSWV